MTTDPLRQLPQIDTLLKTNDLEAAIARYGHAPVAACARDLIAEWRTRLLAGEKEAPDLASLVAAIASRIAEKQAPGLRPVINASGVVLHTNLGRAPLSPRLAAQMQAILSGYSTLEYDVDSGERGQRQRHVEPLLCERLGCEAALVVNNNAAAVLLILAALAREREVVVSRGELVEIGGSFRIPEIMAASGARLVEVGTTNKTRREDYERALSDDTALLLKVHTSNFRIVGFTADVALAELASLARERGLPLVHDLGSGALFDLSAYGLGEEMTAPASLAAGSDLVCFSGDKLLGGPQAGIVAGRRDLIARLSRHPLHRALRVDKMTLAALEMTLLASSDRERALSELPVLRMLTASRADLERRCIAFGERLRGAGLTPDVLPAQGCVGGGAAPFTALESFAVSLSVPAASSADRVARAFRLRERPIVVRIERDRILLDLRTVGENELDELFQAVVEVVGGGVA